MIAKYTVHLKSLLDDPEAKAAIDRALSTYPLYQPDKNYDMIPTREQINKRILNQYKYREIAFSAPGRFVDELEIAMLEIMPRYNELFKTVAIMAELPSPFDNVDVVETFEQERSDKTTGEGTTQAETTSTGSESTMATATAQAHGKTLDVDTPQGTLSLHPAKEINSVDNASFAKWTEDDSESDSESDTERSSTDSTTGSTTATSETTGTTKHTYTKKGNQGVNTYAHDMNEFRTSIIDVVNQIVNDPAIQVLFFMLY